MDKLKDFFRAIRRIHFWLICTLALILSTVMWFMAVGQISEEKEKRASAYKTAFSSVSTQKGKPRIPNDAVAAEMEKLIQTRIAELGIAWKEKYDEQNSEQTGILTWPEEMGIGFVQHMTPLRPIEKELPFPVPDGDLKLTINQRENYREYIQAELPRLASSIGAEWQTSAAAAGAVSGYGGGGYGDEGGGGYGRPGAAGAAGGLGGESLSKQAVVHWDSKNQAELMASHFTWGTAAPTGRVGGRGYGSATTVGFDDESINPDVLEILYAQEDLWVLRAVMKIIKETNGDAKTRFNAAVKTIHSIRIGKDAVASTGRILRTASDAPAEGEETAAVDDYSAGAVTNDGYGGEGYGGGGGSGTPSIYHDPNGAPAGEGADGGEGGARTGYDSYSSEGSMEVETDPAEGRYVDNSYQPLSAEKLRSVLAMAPGTTMEPEDAYLAVAKRIPVRMRLSIDQRKLTNLLIACANSELTVEVRQLRWNPEDVAQLDGTVGGAGGYGGGYGRGGYGGEEGGGVGRAATKPTDDLSTPFPYDVIVEIYGIIYIYNPVDERALGVEPEAGDVSSNKIRRGSLVANRATAVTAWHKRKSLKESWESKLTRTSMFGTWRPW